MPKFPALGSHQQEQPTAIEQLKVFGGRFCVLYLKFRQRLNSLRHGQYLLLGACQNVGWGPVPKTAPKLYGLYYIKVDVTGQWKKKSPDFSGLLDLTGQCRMFEWRPTGDGNEYWGISLNISSI